MTGNENDNERRWLILRAKIYEEKIKSAFKLFRDNNIEPILIKGWAAAREYSESYKRFYSDIDLCIAPDLYEKSIELIADEEGKALNIDLHSGLRHLDTMDWNQLFENSLLLPLDDVQVRVLRPEDHLRVLCVHWLTDGGAYREKLLDFFYLIDNHCDTFNWESCLSSVNPNRRKWIIKTIGLTHKYYNLDISSLPFSEEAKTLPKWLVKSLEKEWSSNLKLKPLHTLLNKKAELWAQIKKRIPPNAIQSTIDMEGDFDDKPRIYYQLGSIIIRLKPALQRIYSNFKIKNLVDKRDK